MSKGNTVLGRKISLLSTISTLSISLLILLIASMVGGIVFYLYMASPPPRYARVDDYGDLLSDADEADILIRLEGIKQSKDVNAFVVTKMGQPYSENLSTNEKNELSRRYAEQTYHNYASAKFTKDNSGFLLLIDMDSRYLFIYTIDRFHAKFSDDDCTAITSTAAPFARDEDYAGAIDVILDKISSSSLSSSKYMLIQAFRFIGPLLITVIVFSCLKAKKKGTKTTSAQTYLVKDKATGKDRDVYSHSTVTVVPLSTSSGGSGGGSSGGGGSNF